MNTFRSLLTSSATAAAIFVSQPANAQDQVRMIDVPAGPASVSVTEFARQANLQIMAPAEALARIQTRAVQGKLPSRTALQILLSGTGLEINTDADGVITLRRAVRNDRPVAQKISTEVVQTQPQSRIDPVVQAEAKAPSEVETITVTGTSIRGSSAVGSNTIAVGRSEIDKLGPISSPQQILTTLPAVSNFNSPGIGQTGNTTTGGNAGGAIGAQGPSIHNLGQAVANTTLVLVDGHRIPYTGTSRSLLDPSFVPVSAIQSVQVLPDGSSAIYGSDALAGVLSFTTRAKFDGLEVSAQASKASKFRRGSGSLLWGTSWDGGNVVLAYDYSYTSELRSRDRSFTTARQDLRLGAVSISGFGLNAQGQPIPATAPVGTPASEPYPSMGPNNNTFACSPATVASTLSSAAFAYPYTAGTGISVTQTNPGLGICNNVGYVALVPRVIRNNLLIRGKQQITDRLTAGAIVIVGSQVQSIHAPRGVITATVYGPGSTPPGGAGQINPFLVPVPGSTTGVQTIRWDADQMLGAGQARTRFSVLTPDVTGYLDWDMGKGWKTNLQGTYGISISNTHTYGNICASCAYEALNGTPNTTGLPNSATNSGLTDVNSLGTVVTASRVLNANNALDIWTPAGAGNRTSAAVIKSLTDSSSSTPTNQSIADFVLKADGPIFSWAGGTVKAAVGGEFTRYTMEQDSTTVGGLGPQTGGGARYLYARYSRNVKAAYAEFYVPLVSEQMNVPFVQELVLNFAGRYDKYSDVGGTKNPKIGFDWKVRDGIKLRGSYGTSFSAPQFGSTQNPKEGVSPEATVGATGVTNGFVFPASYKGSSQAGYGTGLAGTFCAAGCTYNTSAMPGLQIVGGNPDLEPMTGRTYSLGGDINFGRIANFLDGLTMSATYWKVSEKGLIQATPFNATVSNPALQGLTYFAPLGGWAPNDPFVTKLIGNRLLNISLPDRIYTITDFRQYNFFDLQASGVDFVFNYVVPTDHWGTYSINVSGMQQLRFDLKPHAGGPYVNGRNNRTGTYRPLDLQGRTTFGWKYGAFNAQVAWTYLNPYYNLTTVFPNNYASANGSRPAGMQRVEATNLYDLTVGYDLPDRGWTSGTQMRLLVSNIFDKAPAFASTSYDSGTGNPIGREVSLSVKKRF